MTAANDYNLSLNHVDRAKSQKAQNCGAKTIRKGWKALFLWLLNTALVNSYLLPLHSGQSDAFTIPDSFPFAHFTALFDRSDRLARKRKALERVDVQKARVDVPGPHGMKNLGRVRLCIVCKGKRPVLGETNHGLFRSYKTAIQQTRRILYYAGENATHVLPGKYSHNLFIAFGI